MASFIGCALSLVGATFESPDDPNRRFRAGLALARASGCEAVRLDGAAAGMRGRELDRSARRDIAAIMKREGLVFAGIDLWVPEEHFENAAKVDRALDALGDACDLAGELARLTESPRATVCVTLPAKPTPSLIDAVVRPAVGSGVSLADFNRSCLDAGFLIGSALDPAEAILNGSDPVAIVVPMLQTLADARLTDASKLGRCTVGHGRLDVPAYRAVLESLATIRWVSVDVRTMIDPTKSAVEAVSAWRSVQR